MRRFWRKLTVAVADFLSLQVDSGAEVFQVFDSLGGLLSGGEFTAASGKWIKEILGRLRGRAPAIVFSKDMHGDWDALVETGAQVVGIDWSASLAEVAARLPKHVGVQGNLDPFLLSTTPDLVAAETHRILEQIRGRPGHIFNLGHGVPPAAKLENIESLVSTVRHFK